MCINLLNVWTRGTTIVDNHCSALLIVAVGYWNITVLYKEIAPLTQSTGPRIRILTVADVTISKLAVVLHFMLWDKTTDATISSMFIFTTIVLFVPHVVVIFNSVA